MSVTLIGRDNVPLQEIGGLLADELAPGELVPHISIVEMNQILDGHRALDLTQPMVVVSYSQETVSVGDGIEQIRRGMKPEQELVLCMPRPVERQVLLDLGVNEIISPSALSAAHIAERILGHLILKRRIDPCYYPPLWGGTKVMRKLYLEIERCGPLKKQHVMILGETGTGKALVAEALHAAGGPIGKLVHINIAALHHETIESDLFGHLAGAYTGASKTRMGLIESAEVGTAFIDEIGDLSSDLQIKLLDVVENKRVRPMGANLPKPVLARFVFATHQDLEGLISKKAFRQDLYARINQLVLQLPPLRDRMADIPILVEHFIEQFEHDNKTTVILQPGAVDELFRYDWPLNVRELKTVVDRAASRVGASGRITDALFRESIRDPRKAASIDDSYSIQVDPRVDSWADAQARLKEKYFAKLMQVTNTQKQALEKSKIGRSRLHEILTMLGLKHQKDENGQDGSDG